jgi:hypothetical protein
MRGNLITSFFGLLVNSNPTFPSSFYNLNQIRSTSKIGYISLHLPRLYCTNYPYTLLPACAPALFVQSYSFLNKFLASKIRQLQLIQVHQYLDSLKCILTSLNFSVLIFSNVNKYIDLYSSIVFLSVSTSLLFNSLPFAFVFVRETAYKIE